MQRTYHGQQIKRMKNSDMLFIIMASKVTGNTNYDLLFLMLFLM